MENFEKEMYEEAQNVETVDMDSAVDVETEDAGLSTGAAMLIGGGLALAIGAGIKWATDAWKNHKAKKEAKKAEEQQPTETNHDFVEPTDEEIKKVTNTK